VHRFMNRGREEERDEPEEARRQIEVHSNSIGR
jgi:hypothetical protein